MKVLDVSIEIMGKQVPAGQIRGTDQNDAVFEYDKEYIESRNKPLSISLPLKEEPFTAAETKNFFEGLLPEGFARKTVSEWLHTSDDDYLTILQALGEECLGAIRISEKAEYDEGYEQLSIDEVKALAREGISKSTDMIVQAHLSLTGASGKVGLYYDEKSNSWFLPKGTAPSTHIVKQSHVRLGSIVTNEQLSLMTAKALGIEVPESFIIDTGEGKDEDVLFATKRYDRIFSDHQKMTDGLPRPLRLHQEDFAQALGIEASKKYEKAGQRYMKQIFGLLRGCSADPIKDQLKLWDILIFDFLIGNTDNHIKNLSLLYSPDMKKIKLAPAYDIISTCVYPESSRQMAIGINEVYDINQISRDRFSDAAEMAGLGKRMALERFDRMAERFEYSLRESARCLSEMGFSETESICEKILITGGYKNL